MESHCRNICAILLFAISLAIGAQSYRPVYSVRAGHNQVLRKSPVLFRAFPIQMAPQQYRVYLIAELQHDFMQFFEENAVYRARVQLEVTFQEEQQGITRNRIWNVTTETSSFDSTNMTTLYRFTLDSLTLPPGNYRIQLIYRDLNSNRTLLLRSQLVIQAQGNLFYPSPLFCYPDSTSAKFPLCPLRQPAAITEYWDFNRDANWVFHLYPVDTAAALPLRITFFSKDSARALLEVDTTVGFSTPWYTAQLSLPLHRLPEGKYEAIVTIGDTPIRYTVPLTIVWFTKPLSLWSLDTAVPPLKYILDEEAYNALTRGSHKAVAKKFQAFWKARDPDPQTPYNPVQEEFYRRVDEANRRWSDRRTPGWKTDRGKIWILYGKPDAVEDRTLAPEGPRYLKWIYYRNGERIIAIFDAVEGRKIVTLRTLYTEPNNDDTPN